MAAPHKARPGGKGQRQKRQAERVRIKIRRPQPQRGQRRAAGQKEQRRALPPHKQPQRIAKQRQRRCNGHAVEGDARVTTRRSPRRSAKKRRHRVEPAQQQRQAEVVGAGDVIVVVGGEAAVGQQLGQAFVDNAEIADEHIGEPLPQHKQEHNVRRSQAAVQRPEPPRRQAVDGRAKPAQQRPQRARQHGRHPQRRGGVVGPGGAAGRQQHKQQHAEGCIKYAQQFHPHRPRPRFPTDFCYQYSKPARPRQVSLTPPQAPWYVMIASCPNAKR